jgi:hypothetical protein
MSATGNNNPPQAPSTIPPPAWRLPWGTVKNGEVYLNNNGVNFLQLLWSAIVGGGGVMDLNVLNLQNLGGIVGAIGGLTSDQARRSALDLARPAVRETSDQILWTPTLAGVGTAGAQTYATQVGTMAYIGPLVVALFSITLSAFDATTAGDLEVLGLPIDAATSDDVQAGWVGSWGDLTLPGGATQLGVEVAAASSAISLQASGSAAPAAPLTAAALAATSQIAGGVAFFR